jgi:hypothetical protein
MLIRRFLLIAFASATPFAVALACNEPEAGCDENKDNVADDLGKTLDRSGDGFADPIDINNDGIPDGPGVDFYGKNTVNALALDTDCDGFFDSIDVTGDGLPDYESSCQPPRKNVPNCTPGGLGSGGSGGGSGGSSGSGGSGGNVPSQLGNASYQGSGSSSERYAESEVYRNGVGYMFIANGWGTNWQNHQITWLGTSFTVASLNGSQGSDYSPAGYPTVFCGNYSMKQSPACGLPAAINSLSSVRTGWRWASNGNNGQYNAAWDIWIGNGTSLAAYLMVWLRDPPGQQPAGAAAVAGATVNGLPGSWTIWRGTVNNRPIVNYVKPEGSDLSELEFDVMAVYQDAINRGYSLPGTHIMSVAVGFEVWNGPVTNLQSQDFYVDVN